MNPPRIRVKMCGMTRSEDVYHACSLGVDAIGFIFHPKSSRFVTIGQVQKLIQDLPPFVDAVAVLVNPEKEFVDELIGALPINLLQFHGDETPEFCQQFSTSFIKAIQPNSTEAIEQSLSIYTRASALLLDTPSQTSRGGTGICFDWNIIPKNTSKPYVLAGGLNASNVQDAVTACSPYAVDVCSGIEIEPGVKDHLKMSRFIKALWDI
ncbi:MAG: phosphoribosylanthranilate isomerase [Legionellales bacterium]